MDKLIEGISGRSDEELQRMRRNAMRICGDPNSSPSAILRAENLLTAIETELERRHIPGMIETFRKRYPDGFYGDKQAEEERDYKVEASQRCREWLSESAFSELLGNADLSELHERVRKLVNMTNLLQGGFEKPKFLDAIRSAENAGRFYPALYDCLHGPGEPAERLGRFASVLEDLGLSKWTYATYFLFLNDPEHCMFVKPEMLKRSLEISQYPVEYEARPTEFLYEQILEFCRWLKSNIRELQPRDLIDVHSFMWHMAPTGKWADAD